jgi:predicted RND superfamily exporter protein
MRLRTLVQFVAVPLLLTAIGGGLARVRVQTGLESFLPATDASVTALNGLSSTFGGEPIVVLLKSAKTRQLLDEDHLPKLIALEGRLSALPNVAAVYGPGTILNQIAGQTQDLLAELSGRRDALQAQAEAQAKARGASPSAVSQAGSQALAQFDSRYGPLLVTGLPAGLPTLHNPRFVDSVIFSGHPQPRAQWHFVVPNSDSIVILVRPRQRLDAGASMQLVDNVQQQVQLAKMGAAQTTVSGVPAIVAALSRQGSRDVPWLGVTGLLCVSACFMLVPWTEPRRRLRPLLSTIIAIAMTVAAYGWLNRSLSLGVVTFLPVLLGIGSYYPTYFVRQPDRRAIFTVALATAASFATLAFTPLPFVRDLGSALAVGILFSVLCAAVLTRSPAGGPAPAVDEPKSKRTTWTAVSAAAAVLSILGWLALPALRVQTNVENYASGLPALRAAEEVATTVGSSAELDVALTGPDALNTASFRWLTQAQNGVLAAHGDVAHPIVSVPTLLSFLGSRPTAEEIDAGARLVPTYLLGAAVSADHSTALLSYGVDLSNLPAMQRLIADIRGHLPAAPPGFHASLVGLPVVAVRGEELVSGDRYPANILGILAATTVLAIGLRRRSDALRAGATALVANGLGLLGLWLAGVALTPLTVPLGALTGAIACEFTVMLADARRHGRARLTSSIALAALASTVGYLTVLASGLAVIREFGVLLAGAVILAWLSAVCVVAATAPRNHRPSETLEPQHPKIPIGASA